MSAASAPQQQHHHHHHHQHCSVVDAGRSRKMKPQRSPPARRSNNKQPSCTTRDEALAPQKLCLDNDDGTVIVPELDLDLLQMGFEGPALRLPPGLPLPFLRPPPGLESSVPNFPLPSQAHAHGLASALQRQRQQNPFGKAAADRRPGEEDHKIHEKNEDHQAGSAPVLPSLMLAAHRAAVAATPRPAEPHVKILPISAGDVLLRTRAEWSVDHVQAKLRTSCGFPLVSPVFSAQSLPPLRFMFAPGQLWSATRGRPQQQGPQAPPQRSTRRSSDNATPFGALKLKAGSPEAGTVVTLYLTIGSLRLGPLTFDFTERAVHSAELPEDWAPHVEAENERLVLGVEFLSAEPLDH